MQGEPWLSQVYVVCDLLRLGLRALPLYINAVRSIEKRLFTLVLLRKDLITRTMNRSSPRLPELETQWPRFLYT